MRNSNKRIPVKKLKTTVHTKLSIHPKLRTELDISGKIIEDKIKKKYGNNIDHKVPRNCIQTIVEELLDEIENN